MMDAKKALDVMKRFSVVTFNHRIDGDRVMEPMRMAIEALEKQVPMEPVGKTHDVLGTPEWHDHCPKCGEEFFQVLDYCPYCGQAIDWED